jgi:hypothetical protein
MQCGSRQLGQFIQSHAALLNREKLLFAALDAHQIRDNRRDILLVDRCLVHMEHLFGFGLPGRRRQRRLMSTIPAEWQARQLLLTTSDPGPENMVPRSGRSIETDLSVSGDWAWTASGVAAALNSASVNIMRDMGDLLKPRRWGLLR